MSRFVRSSKVRHVYGETAKTPFHWSDIRLSPLAGDQQHIKGNDLFFAVPVSRGSLALLPLDRPGKCPPQLPMLDGHKGKVVDFDFSPFHSTIIATGGDDSTLKLWKVPATGLEETLVEPLVDMEGHQKKVSLVRFHPTADSVCATGSVDHTVKLWDVSSGEIRWEIGVHEMVQDAVWNHTGSLLATSTKDKKVNLIDPRSGGSGAIVATTEAHDGSKPCKLVFLGSEHKLATVGFSRNSTRSFKLWDHRKGMTAPYVHCKLDQSAGAMMPFYDSSLNLLYISGKGDANVRYFELTDAAPWQYKIDEFRTSRPCKGMCMLPKRMVNVMKHEVAKFLRLTTDSVEPVSFYLPRKSEVFQADIYPPCFSGVASVTAEDYFTPETTQSTEPKVMSLDPSDRASANGLAESSISSDASANGFLKKKSKKEIEAELGQAKQYIDLLTSKLKAQGIEVPAAPEALQRAQQ